MRGRSAGDPSLPDGFPADFPAPPQWSSALSRAELEAFYRAPHPGWRATGPGSAAPSLGPIALPSAVFLTHVSDGLAATALALALALRPRAPYALGADRQLAHARAARREDRVRDRGRHRHGAGLADTGRRLRLVAHHVDVDLFGRVAEGRDRVRVPAGRRDAAVPLTELLDQGPARGLLDAALDLVAHAVGIHDETRVDRAPEAREAWRPVRGDDDLGDLRAVGPMVDGAGEPLAQTRGRALAQRRALRDGLDHPTQARVVDVPEAKGEWIRPRRERELVHQ